ncbi:Sulfur oxidation protein SoxY [hydrothermal vent metagenome]|uniref:Sulfur oxidation protein SoxY n=1 Tax=hydrothermal vent metagenome TaxID=652676 RepID=A0A3B1EA89_9ZZZZ
MERRKFLGLGLGVAALSIAPSTLSAIDFRTTKPKAWSTTNSMKNKKIDATNLDGMNAAIKELFGSSKTMNKKIKLKAPAIAENGAVIPVTVSTKLNAKTIGIFQSSNPEATVAVFTIDKNSIPNYSIRIKMAQTGTVKVVAEVDGKLYSAEQIVKVTAGGCGG